MTTNNNKQVNAEVSDSTLNSEPITNLLTRKVQFERVTFALLALTYAVYSYTRHDLYMPAKHGQGMHFHGVSASLLELMLFFSALTCLLPLGILYDKRVKQPSYEKLRRHSAFVTYALFGLGAFYNAFNLTDASDVYTPSWFLRLFGWLGLGVLSAQLGRLPPSYLRKRPNPKLSNGVTYFAAFLLAVIAVGFFALTAFIVSNRPDKILSLWVLIPLALGIGFAFWGYSIVRRSGKNIDV